MIASPIDFIAKFRTGLDALILEHDVIANLNARVETID